MGFLTYSKVVNYVVYYNGNCIFVQYVRNLIVILLLTLSQAAALAQAPLAKWGTAYKNKKNSYITKFLGSDGESLYTLRYSEGYVFSYTPHVWLESYDAYSLNQTLQMELEIPTRNKIPVTVEDAFMVDGQIVLITSFINTDNLKRSIYAYLVDKSGKVLPKNYTEADNFAMENRRDPRRFYFTLSSDSAKLLSCHLQYNQTREREDLVCRAIDGSLMQRFYHKIELPYKDTEAEIAQTATDTTGNVFVLFRLYNVDEGFFTSNRKPAGYRILHIAPDKTERWFNPALPDKQISEISLKAIGNNQLLFAGFYSKRGKSEDEIAGTFFVKLNAETGQIERSSATDFTDEFLGQFMSAKSIKKGKELFRYPLRDFVLQPNGHTVLVAEQAYEEVLCFFDNRTGIQTCNTHHYFNDIILVDIKPDGQVNWTTRIPKKQETINDGGAYSSYLLLPQPDTLLLLYNDDIRNFSEEMRNFNVTNFTPDLYNFTRPHKAQTAIVRVDLQGKTIKRPLALNAPDFAVFRPGMFYHLNPEATIIFAENGNRYRLGKLLFK